MVTAELPGLGTGDVHIDFVDGRLTVSGVRPERSGACEQYHRIERRYGSFSRSFSLPQTVDTGKVGAEYKNGVLTIRLPLREEAKPRQVKIDVAA